MPILRPEDSDAVKQRFDTDLKKDVKLTHFTSPNTGIFVPGRECQTCGPAQEIMEEVSTLSDKIELELVDYYADESRAEELGIERIPATVITSNGNTGARYYGLPLGYEFSVLVDTIVNAGSNQSSLPTQTRRQLKHLKSDVHVQVFVTPN